MTPHAIESWVLRIVDQVSRDQHCEDSLVELKREWPSPQSAARILAGHANAAHGQKILWIVGLDEKAGAVGAPPNELADWFSAVRGCFESTAPVVQDLNVPVGVKTLVALVFDTDRAPFVVRNPVFGQSGGGAVEREVPWREGRKTLSARREHLLRLLAPVSELPDAECMSIEVSTWIDGLPGRPPVHMWSIRTAL